MATSVPGSRWTLSGFSPEYDWRPTEFEDPVDGRRICACCRVLTRGTALLGCSHALCEPCYTATLVKGGQRCPLDDSAYAEGEVEWLSTSAEEMEGLRAKCWNSGSGCPFVATLSELPSHFYQKCRFQAVACESCGSSVPRSSMLDHRKVCCARRDGAALETNGAADASGPSKFSGDFEKSPGLSLAEVVDFQYSLETKVNSLVEHVHRGDAAGVSKSELLTATVGLLRSVGLLSLSATWRPRGLAVVVSRVRYFLRQAPKYAEEVYSAPFDVCGYSLRLGVRCERKLASPTKSCDCAADEDLVLKFVAQLCPGAKNPALQWPFRKSLTLSVVHPQDSTKEVRFFLNTSAMAAQPSFQIPGSQDNPPFGIGGPLHVAALAGCQFWSYGTLQLRLGMTLSSGERDQGN